ncbi:MAG: type II toxin-antitoxin system VapC family toxin [Rubrivivax sp.]|nr:type II toxin-antitoxin system VapC family toxin [Rubrivivax sp.]
MLDVPSLLARLEGRRVYLDTNIFIYVLNDTPGFAAPSLMLLQACAERRIVGLTGDVTLAELLVKPLQTNDAAAVAAVKELLVHDGAITLVGHDRAAFERAAQHRARHGLKMVDALQLATAELADARCLISNDRQFPPLPDIECLSLAG